jgi:hypothetical protein
MGMKLILKTLLAGGITLGLSLPVFAQTELPKGVAIGSAGFNEMLGKQLGSDALLTEALPDGTFKFTNSVQTLQAQVTIRGTTFSSTSQEADKGGAFSLGITQWGRENNLQPVISSQIYREGDTVFHSYADGIAEKFTNTGNGIRQDFIIPVKPQGNGALQVQLHVEGATLNSKADGFSVALANSQRTLTYDRLKVTDADNKTLPAHMQLLANNQINIVVDDSTALYPLTIDPTVGDENWVGAVGAPNGYVGHIVCKGSNIYIVGGFTSVSGVSANGIAKWDGTDWSALGSGVTSVYALAVDSMDNVYVGGAFTTAGGVSATHIAKWNGTVWSALGSGLNANSGFGGVYALAIDSNNNVYAGGQFYFSGSVYNLNQIAKWNGTTWSALGLGVANGHIETIPEPPAYTTSVNALAVDSNDNLYVGGDFATAGGVNVNHIAKWNGTVWSSLGGGISCAGCYPKVYAFSVDSNNNVYAAGDFTTAGGISTNRIAKWSGTAWEALSTGMNGDVSELAVDSNDTVYAAGGHFTTAGGVSVNRIAKWDGTAWSALASGTNNWVYAIAIDGSNNVMVGGSFTTAGGKALPYLAEWLDGDGDADNDTVLNGSDNCLLKANVDQLNTDGDTQGNACDSDDDNDGVADGSDAFPLNAAESIDTDSDGTGNNADADDDNDGVADGSDAFPLNAAESIDTDSDSTGNNADTDDDNDGVADGSDAFPLNAAESVDTDSDGTGNNADADDDNDGVPDVNDAAPLDPLILCSAGNFWNGSVCSASTPVANCTIYSTNTDACSTCDVGYDLVGGACALISHKVKNDYNNDGIAGWIWKGQSNGYETESQNWQLTFPLSSPNFGVPNRFYHPVFPNQIKWELVTTGDFNQDGDADILWRHKTLAAWKVWQMQNGTRVAQNAPADFDLAHQWQVVGAGDTDNDGDDDVILNNATTGEVLIWEMQNHAIANTHAVGTKVGYLVNRIGDFNKDGDVDLLFRQVGTNLLATWELQANAFVLERTFSNTGAGYNPVCAGDFDADGDDDIMLINGATMTEKWFVVENFAYTKVFGSSNTGFVFKACADYDGDGDADTLWQRSSDDMNRVVLQQNFGVTKQTVYTNAFGGVNPGAAGYGFVYRGNSN